MGGASGGGGVRRAGEDGEVDREAGGMGRERGERNGAAWREVSEVVAYVNGDGRGLECGVFGDDVGRLVEQHARAGDDAEVGRRDDAGGGLRDRAGARIEPYGAGGRGDGGVE